MLKREPSTQMDQELLDVLLRGGHINMEIRRERGMWPHAPLQLDDLVRALAEILERERWFPHEFEPATPGNAVREGGVIERAGPHRYVYRAQRAHPIMPTALADKAERVFDSATAAARHYLRWDLQLPGNLDGYEVVD